MPAYPPPLLPISLKPHLGEKAQGFLRRLAAANGHAFMSVFTRALGIDTGFGPTSADDVWARLAQATGLEDADLAPMRWRKPELGPDESRIVVTGVQTTRGFARARSLWLCPACLREAGIQREFWSFTIVAACPRHGTLLATHCHCGRQLPVSCLGAAWRCRCGVDFVDLVQAAAPASAVRAARGLAARMGEASGYACENDLPAPFDALCAHDYMVVVHTFGVAKTTPSCDDARVPTKATGMYRASPREAVPREALLARLDSAMLVVDGWPNAFFALLKEVEGRNPTTGTSTIAGAFATSIGRLLVDPIKGADGLPLRLLHQAADRYWAEPANGRRRRKRRARSTTDTTAKRLRLLVSVTGLARAVGAPLPSRLLARVFSRALEMLGGEERTLGVDELACRVRALAAALLERAKASLSSERAKELLEGTASANRLSGWEHPRLAPADPDLHGLRYSGRPAYAPETVEAALARLRSVARRVDALDGLAPLVSAGLRGMVGSRCSKADLLLDVVDGNLPVYTDTAAPRLCDLFVDPRDLRLAHSVHALAADGSGMGFAGHRRINSLLRDRFGPAGPLTLSEFRRLARARLVRHRVEFRASRSGRPVQQPRLYAVEDVLGFVRRRAGPDGLPFAEAAAFGRLDDVGPLLVAMRAAGIPRLRIEAELAAAGVKTPAGAPWRRGAVNGFIEGKGKPEPVLGLLTGPSFAEGVVLVGRSLTPAAAGSRAFCEPAGRMHPAPP